MINGMMLAEIQQKLGSLTKYNQYRKEWCEACLKVNKRSGNKEILEKIRAKEEKRRKEEKKSGSKGITKKHSSQ